MIRPVHPEDVPFLRQMIYEGAFHEAAYPPGQRPSFEEALADPRAARFVEGWGRPGDFGVVAVEDGHPVGAAWCRLLRRPRMGDRRRDGLARVWWTGRDLATEIQEQEKGCPEADRHTHRSFAAKPSGTDTRLG